MLNFFSILLGLVSCLVMLIGIIPLLGWLNWLMMGFATFGVILGALSDKRSGLIINVVAIVIGGLRLLLGGGIL